MAAKYIVKLRKLSPHPAQTAIGPISLSAVVVRELETLSKAEGNKKGKDAEELRNKEQLEAV